MRNSVTATFGLFALAAPFLVTVACGSAPSESTEKDDQALATVSPACNVVDSTGVHAMCVSQGTGDPSPGGGKPAPAPTTPPPPAPHTLTGCLVVAGSWSLATPPCTAVDAGVFTGPLAGPSQSIAEECDAEWALWSQLQAAGCTTPGQVLYGEGTEVSGDFYAWCPPGNYGDQTTSSVPGDCSVPASSIPADTQLVLWSTYDPNGGGVGGCKIPACQTY